MSLWNYDNDNGNNAVSAQNVPKSVSNIWSTKPIPIHLKFIVEVMKLNFCIKPITLIAEVFYIIEYGFVIFLQYLSKHLAMPFTICMLN